MKISADTKTYSGIFTPVMALAFYAIASGYLMSILPLLLPVFGLNNTLVSWLASAYYAGLLVGTLYCERLLVKLGHKKAFGTFLGLFTLSLILLPLFPSDNLWLSVRFLQGICVGGLFVTMESWLLFGEENTRAKRLSFYMCSLYAASAIGQLGLGFHVENPVMPFVYAGIILIIGSVIIGFGKSSQPTLTTVNKVEFRQLAKLDHAAIIGCTVSGIVLGGIYGLLPAALKSKGIASEDIGNLMAVIILGAMLVQPVISVLSNYLGRTLLIAMSCLFGASSIVLYSFGHSMLMLTIGLFMLGMAAFSIYPVSLNLGSKNLAPERITMGSKMMLFSYSVGSVAGPLGANWFSAYDNNVMHFLFIVLLSTCIYMLLASLRTRRQWVAPKQ